MKNKINNEDICECGHYREIHENNRICGVGVCLKKCKKFKIRKTKKRNQSQRKKDETEARMSTSGDTKKKEGKTIKSEQMPLGSDNHADVQTPGDKKNLLLDNSNSSSGDLNSKNTRNPGKNDFKTLKDIEDQIVIFGNHIRCVPTQDLKAEAIKRVKNCDELLSMVTDRECNQTVGEHKCGGCKRDIWFNNLTEDDLLSDEKKASWSEEELK